MVATAGRGRGVRSRSERLLEIECCNIARIRGLAAVKLEKNANKGIPDYLFVQRGGMALFVEFKRPEGSGVVSAEQLYWAEFLGGSHEFIDSVERFVEVVDAFFGQDDAPVGSP